MGEHGKHANREGFGNTSDKSRRITGLEANERGSSSSKTNRPVTGKIWKRGIKPLKRHWKEEGK